MVMQEKKWLELHEFKQLFVVTLVLDLNCLLVRQICISVIKEFFRFNNYKILCKKCLEILKI